MKKENTKKKRTILQVVRILSLRLQNSKEIVLNRLEPELIEVDIYSKQREDNFQHRRFNFNETSGVESEPTWCEDELREIEYDIRTLSQYLRCTPIQAALFVGCFTKNLKSEYFDIDDIVNFFELTNIDFIFLKKDWELLQEQCLIEPYESPFDNDSFSINCAVKQAIYSDEPLPELKSKEYTRYTFVREIAHYVENHNENSTRSLRSAVRFAEDKAKGLEFVSEVTSWKLDIETRTLLYDICHDFVSSSQQMSDLDATLRDIYDSIEERFSVAGQLMQGEHILQKMDLLDIQSATMLSDAHIFLTEKGKRLFLEKDYRIFAKQTSNQKLIQPKSIAVKEMFFDADLQKQLDFLEETLESKKFKSLQKRLEEKSMPKGVVALFYGQPGTGKTESVKQIAKRTGRSIYHVDISAAKSCWYGESQKLVKRIFIDYAEMCKNEKRTPILLFNEADALFSSRHDTGRNSRSTSTDQTENAIQNIILEEMEKIEGIMIATSNLADNLDPAFDRRFLFKVEFGQPSLEAKKAIWRSKIDWLSDEECERLAGKYDFSGGEIDNIARKATMEQVLHGEQPTLAILEDLCKHEKIGDKNKSIGFKN